MGEAVYTRKSKIDKIEKEYKLPIKELCYRLHHIEKKPLRQIAKIFGIRQHTIGRWFRLLEIPVENRTQFKKGQEPWIKGKKQSKDTVEKCRIKIRIGQTPWNKGITKEIDVRIERQIETRRERGGFTPSKRTRDLNSKAMEKRWRDPEDAKKMIKGLWHQRGMPSPTIGYKHTDETKKRMKSIVEEHWKNTEIAKKMIAGLQLRPNKYELKLSALLQKKFPDEWRYVGDGQVIIGGLCPDFINCNGKKKIIELFGEYWHKGQHIKPHRTEEGRRELFNQFGFDMLVIWASELKDEKQVIAKLEEWQHG